MTIRMMDFSLRVDIHRYAIFLKAESIQYSETYPPGFHLTWLIEPGTTDGMIPDRVTKIMIRNSMEMAL